MASNEKTWILRSSDEDVQIESASPKNDSVYKISRIVFVLFFLGTLGVLSLGAGVGITNALRHTEVDGTGNGTSITDYKPARPTVFGRYRFAAVAADSPECSTVGTEILGEGGSSVDAAIATSLCVGLVNPHSSGIGGGSFMLIYDTPPGEDKKKMTAFDFRETTPKYLSTSFYDDDSSKMSTGPHSISIPSEIRGYYHAWLQYGKLPWKRLFRPVIRMCLTGYPLRDGTASALKTKWDQMKDSPSWRELFLNGEGQLYQKGDRMKNPRLAKTFEAIASDPDGFYTGPLAELILQDLAEAGSQIDEDDLKMYQPLWKEPTVTNLSSLGFTSYTMPAPSSGPIYNFMLRLIESYNFQKNDIRYRAQAVETYHRIAEIFKFGFAERTYLGDPDYVNITEYTDRWNSDIYLKKIRRHIDNSSTHDIPYYHPSTEVTIDSGTCHLSILAQDGSAVSTTTTVNTHFGSLIRGSRTGIIFNNEMSDFSLPGPPNEDGLPPNAANFPEPGKRPLSSMVPNIMLETASGRVRLVTGAAGSERILTGTTYVTAHNLWLGLRIDQAVDAPRLHHKLSPNILSHEADFPKDIVVGLSKKGHVQEKTTSYSVCQAIRSYCEPCDHEAICRTTCIHAASDRRKGGAPDGY